MEQKDVQDLLSERFSSFSTIEKSYAGLLGMRLILACLEVRDRIPEEEVSLSVDVATLRVCADILEKSIPAGKSGVASETTQSKQVVH